MCVTMNDCPNVVALGMSGKLLEQVISCERSNEGERDPFIHQEEHTVQEGKHIREQYKQRPDGRLQGVRKF